jgi:hypothetical protein
MKKKKICLVVPAVPAVHITLTALALVEREDLFVCHVGRLSLHNELY